ncbi:MAG: hypothetical protein HYZ58_18245 [Acidobacteria bacterium]|nr:hypothetical protein [Acidobacteriota bacterium]
MASLHEIGDSVARVSLEKPGRRPSRGRRFRAVAQPVDDRHEHPVWKWCNNVGVSGLLLLECHPR